MKTAQLAAILIIFLVCGCTGVQSTPEAGSPGWIKTLISQYQNAPVGNPPQSIWQYEYNGRTVYYIPPQCCDQFSRLYDASGKIICAPDGGLTGAGDGKCSDFPTVRRDGVIIWSDPRSK